MFGFTVHLGYNCFGCSKDWALEMRFLIGETWVPFRDLGLSKPVQELTPDQLNHGKPRWRRRF
jgi:hypothetical protein